MDKMNKYLKYKQLAEELLKKGNVVGTKSNKPDFVRQYLARNIDNRALAIEVETLVNLPFYEDIQTLIKSTTTDLIGGLPKDKWEAITSKQIDNFLPVSNELKNSLNRLETYTLQWWQYVRWNKSDLYGANAANFETLWDYLLDNYHPNLFYMAQIYIFLMGKNLFPKQTFNPHVCTWKVGDEPYMIDVKSGKYRLFKGGDVVGAFDNPTDFFDFINI